MVGPCFQKWYIEFQMDELDEPSVMDALIGTRCLVYISLCVCLFYLVSVNPFRLVFMRSLGILLEWVALKDKELFFRSSVSSRSFLYMYMCALTMYILKVCPSI